MSEPSRSFDQGALERGLEGGLEVRRAEVRVLDEPACVEGHFPGDPIVPGVSQLVDIVQARIHEGWPALARPSGMKRVKFLAAIRPGDRLQLVLTRKPGAHSVKFEIRRGEELATRGSMEFPAG